MTDSPADADRVQSTGPRVKGARLGFTLGIATGTVVAVVDAAYSAFGDFAGSRLALVFSIGALVIPFVAVLGALAGAWLGLVFRLARPRQGFFASLGTSSLAALPVVAFVLWVPSTWIVERWAGFASRERAATAAVLFALATIVLIAARVVLGIGRRWASGRVRPWWLYAAALATVLMAGACYWADAALYEGDYYEFHYGLGMAFVGAVACLIAMLLSLVSRRRPVLAERFLPGSKGLKIAAFSLLAALFVVALAPVNRFGRSNALVFRKLIETARGLTDLDGDRYSSIFGGRDCAPFDVSLSPGRPEIPENGIDEDCSGKDATWPPPLELRPGKKPGSDWNVVLISIDALRADHLGTYGYRRRTSPHIDRLAARSLVFLEAFSQASKTGDSVPSFLTGSYPSNVPRDYEASRSRKAWIYVLGADARPIAEVLRERGYATGAGLGSTALRVMGLERGFDVFRSDPAGTAQRFLATAARPFFLWLHFSQPHYPYRKNPRRDFGNKPVDLYDGEVAAADADVGAVLRQLDDLHLRESTLVIITADHGEEFGEHGGTRHTRKLYRELLHVPLIVYVPGGESRRVREPVELVDIVPTVCEALGIELPPGTTDGQSLLTSRRQRAQRGAYSEDVEVVTSEVVQRALFDGRFRLIDDQRRDRLELYDTRSDRREQLDVSAGHPDVVSELSEVISVRAVRRHTLPFRELGPKASIDVWKRWLPTIHRAEMVGLALDRFPPERSPARDAVLRQLMERPGLRPQLSERIDELLATP
jgi:arylsulfatase A-like enzyme